MDSQHLIQARLTKGVAERAKALIGKPYKHLGRGAHGVDCLGLAAYALDKRVEDYVPADMGDTGYFVDVSWDRKKKSAENRANSELLTQFVSQHLLEVQWSVMKAGDLITFSVKLGEGYPDHVGIFIGDGQFVHATKDGVVEQELTQNWLARTIGCYRIKNG